MRWFTADLHLGHANILDYCRRPFAHVEEMNDVLIERLNDRVGPDDELWVLGDFALGPILRTLPLVERLNGRRVLLSGNHDRCWPGHGRRADGWEERYLDAGFDAVRHGTVSLTVGGQSVLAGHFPYRGDSQEVDRHVGHRPGDRGAWLLHGHTHGRWRVDERQVDVGVDAWGYRPVSEATLAAVLAEGPTTLAPLRPGPAAADAAGRGRAASPGTSPPPGARRRPG